MNLNSLPDEIVAGIFKYNTYETVRSIRKMDSRLNKIAVKYDLTRIPVEEVALELDISGNALGKSQISKCCLQFEEHIRKYFNVPEAKMRGLGHWTMQGTVTQQKLKELLKKVKIQTSFDYIVHTTENFNDAIIQQKQCFRSVKKMLLFFGYDASCLTGNQFRQLLSNCKEVNHLYFNTKDGLDEICRTDILCGRKWNRLQFSHSGPHNPVLNGIDRDFLYRVIANCQLFEIQSHPIHISSEFVHSVQFTITDLMNLVEERLVEDYFFSNQKWALAMVVPLGERTLEKLHQRLLQMERVKHEFMPIRNNLMQFSLTMPSHPDVFICFLVNGNLDNIVF